MMCAVCMFDGRRQADQIEQLQADLAAARALLQEAISSVNTHAFSSADRLAERIEAFLAGKEAP